MVGGAHSYTRDKFAVNHVVVYVNIIQIRHVFVFIYYYEECCHV